MRPAAFALLCCAILPPVPLMAEQDKPRGVRAGSAPISCQDSLDDLRSKGAPFVKHGATLIFAGYRQASRNNQNPVIVRFDNSGKTWCRQDYETGGDDSRAYGLFFDGAHLYAAFSVTGTQGPKSKDFRRFTRRGWLKSYGKGGGPKAAVILQLAPNNGKALGGTFLGAVLKNGKTNTLQVTDMRLTGRGLEVDAKAWYSPRGPDRKALACAGKSPFATKMLFNENLSKLEEIEAERCR